MPPAPTTPLRQLSLSLSSPSSPLLNLLNLFFHTATLRHAHIHQEVLLSGFSLGPAKMVRQYHFLFFLHFSFCTTQRAFPPQNFDLSLWLSPATFALAVP